VLENRGNHTFVIAAVSLCATLLIVFPAYVMLSTGLKSSETIFASPPQLVPNPVVVGNYPDVLFRSQIGSNLINSAILSLGTAILVLLLAFPAAYSVARHRFRGRRLFMFSLLALQVFAPITLIVGAFKLMATYGLVDSYWGLILMDSAFALPFGVWLLQGYISTIPREIEEAARVDGASGLRLLASVVVPLALPGLATVAMYGFVTAWNEFLFALTLIQRDELKPVTVGLMSFRGLYSTRWDLLMAGATLATIPPLIVFFVISRSMIRGLTGGAVR
jgi:multiple sugar transport system permease protein